MTRDENGPLAWKLWLFPFSLVVVCTVGLVFLSYRSDAWGYAAALGVPLVMGGVLGYGVRLEIAVSMLLGICGLGAVVIFLITGHIAGLLCGVVLAIIFMIPLTAGLLFGVALQRRLRHRSFWSLWILLPFVLCGASIQIERALVPEAPLETVVTARIVPHTPDAAWESLIFYEEVRHAPPLLARIGLPHPLYTSGTIEGVGDEKVCVYNKGHLRKRITEFRPGRALAFDVVEQVGIEDGSARLIRGSFEFERVGPHATRITLTTDYVPLLSARHVWRPFEIRLARTLHEHVLDGIELEVQRRRELLIAEDRQ